MDKKEISSNYDALCEMWREKFLTWDLLEICRNLQLPGLHEDYLDISYFNIPYRICRKTGVITNGRRPEEKLVFATQMAIYHLLYYSKTGAANSGEWIPFREVKGAGPFDSAFQKIVLKPLAEAFTGRMDELQLAGDGLGFTRLQYGDVSFMADVFSCMKIIFIFWEGDDEFPAQTNILFDKNITDFTHEETVVLIAEDGADLLMNFITM